MAGRLSKGLTADGGIRITSWANQLVWTEGGWRHVGSGRLTASTATACRRIFKAIEEIGALADRDSSFIVKDEPERRRRLWDKTSAYFVEWAHGGAWNYRLRFPFFIIFRPKQRRSFRFLERHSGGGGRSPKVFWCSKPPRQIEPRESMFDAIKIPRPVALKSGDTVLRIQFETAGTITARDIDSSGRQSWERKHKASGRFEEIREAASARRGGSMAKARPNSRRARTPALGTGPRALD